MGKVFADFFQKQGYEVLIVDQETELSLSDAVPRCDIILVSVPISKTVEIIAEAGKKMRSDALLIDIASIKEKPLLAMKTHCQGDYLALHPMFGPSNFSSGQTIIFCEGKGEKWRKEIKNLFSDFHLVEISAKEHDQKMALIQGGEHFLNVAFAKLITEYNYSLADLKTVESPVYQIQMALLGRILGQNKNLYADIIFENEEARRAISRFSEIISELSEGGKEGFTKAFQESQDFFGDFCLDAQKESDALITFLLEQKKQSIIEKKEEDITGDIAVLGPAFTWSDLACQYFFPEEKKIFCKDFSSLFTALDEGRVSAAFLPIENTISGTVRPVWNILASGKYHILSAGNFSISHVFAVLETEKVEHIFGHSEALAQCSHFLQKHYPKAHIAAVSSNSQALLEAKKQKNSAAICSRKAALLHGFSLLHEDIANHAENTTRFALIQKKSSHSSFAQKGKSGNIVTSLCFELPNRPGALLDILQIFSDAKKNLVKLESVSTGSQFSNYRFFVDMEGEIDIYLLENLIKKTEILFSLGTYLIWK